MTSFTKRIFVYIKNPRVAARCYQPERIHTFMPAVLESGEMCWHTGVAAAKLGAWTTSFSTIRSAETPQQIYFPASRGLQHKTKRLLVRVVLPTNQKLCSKIACSQNSTTTPFAIESKKSVVRVTWIGYLM
jgi:hypothetical protein